MKKYTLFFLLFLCLVYSLSGQKLPAGYTQVKELGGIKEFKLESNGLVILLKEDHTAPVLTFMVTYKVGSRDEVTGNTGSTHLLEHLMFKGSPTFNKKDGTSIDIEFGKAGAMVNATTWLDRTNYFESLPNTHLELAIKIEADRMRNAFINEEDRQAEMTVVRNEFEQGENDPLYALDKQIWATAYQAHPYHHSTIGWRSDIEKVPIEKLKAFYDTYYWPNNATITLIGDFSESQALEYIKKHFGAIAASPKPIPQVYTQEPEQQGQRRMIVKRAGQLGMVGIAYKTPKGLEQDTYPMKVLVSILAEDKTSRLYKALVDKGLATTINPSYDIFKDEGLFIPYVYLTPGIKQEDVEKIILDEFEKIKASGVTAQEVSRAINKIITQKAYQSDGSYSLASQINEAIAMGDWTFYVNFNDNIQKVQPIQVQAAARKYLLTDKSTVGYFIPKAEEGSTAIINSPAKNRESVQTPLYYRNPALTYLESADKHDQQVPGQKNSKVLPGNTFASQVQFKQINGAKVYAMKTDVKDVVTLTGSIYAGETTSPADNSKLAHFVGSMLDKGTIKKSKFDIAEQLENIGASISFNITRHTLNFNAKCLKKDLPIVIGLIEEQLKFPAFKDEEIDKLKKQLKASIQQNTEKTNFMANQALLAQLYPKTHPNYPVSVEQSLKDIDKITGSDIRAFHKKYYGPASMIIVAVGDVEVPVFQKLVSNALQGFSGGITYPAIAKATHAPAEKKVVVEMKEKASATLAIGMATGLKQTDKDYLPLFVGNQVLGGGGFTGRLMSIIRDDEGLTYGIYSYHTGDVFSDGYFGVTGQFAPELLDKGYASTMREFNRWIKEGISEKDLQDKKMNIVGSFKVELSTTGGIANEILNTIQAGLPISYLDEFPARIEALTLAEVNAAMKKYIDPSKMVVVMAGSIDKEGKPQGAANKN
ncbi:insulinase family protein [Rhodocytophaga rosea]|uniref:Insulinase family protein n=1 Tax=Rhodocytophaga rosea TaxID=2704465 RepID=A0A6C0GRL2_9BACT|nr:pitrilysin family protein [Rhodocytophaga rosea]QHT70706.1 insulinase family protein [Rhodocytophaga rosea]